MDRGSRKEHRTIAPQRCGGCSVVIPPAGAGLWLVRDRRHGVERAFATQRAALRFALFGEVSGAPTGAALLAPPACAAR